MNKFYIPLILFFLVILEGVALDLLPNIIISGKTLIVSHWVFVFLVLVAIFYDKSNTYFSVLYAVIFGLLIDIVYTDVLGVYMFTYTIVIYVIHQLTRLFQANFYMTILYMIIGITLIDILLFLLYSVIGKVHFLWDDYVFYRLLPTVLANIIFAIILYPIFKNLLISWGNREAKDPIFK